MNSQPKFSPGKNIAMKIPPHQYDETLRFYRDVLGLKEITSHAPSIGFEYGTNNLWIDSVPGISQAEIWLEIVTNDVSVAAGKMKAEGIVRCDEIEQLPEGFQGFWISSPASIIHLICQDTDSWSK